MATKKSSLRAAERGERVTVYLSEELAQALRIHCATYRMSLSAAVSESVTAMLERKKRRQ